MGAAAFLILDMVVGKQFYDKVLTAPQVRFSHGGPEYDAKYPDGIPTAIDITLGSGKAELVVCLWDMGVVCFCAPLI